MHDTYRYVSTIFLTLPFYPNFLTDESNTINLKIFPTRPPPAPIFAWHVPLATVQLNMLSNSSDLTLTRILPFIDGVASVSQIAQMADTDVTLTKKAIAHLQYYGCVILLDIFQFSAIYAPTAEISSFVEDHEAQDEAIRYIAVGRYRRLTEQEVSQGSTGEQWAWKSDETTLDKARLIQLYLSLKQGLTLKNWCLERSTLVMGIDVRRFITFGIIKGFLYRVHKYALLDGTAVTNEVNLNKTGEEFTFDPERIEHWRENSRRGSATGSPGRDLPLAKYLDGMHCFDEICSELQHTEKEVTDRMKDIYKNVTFIYR
jgi:nitrogen permease regulator 2-like protein